MICQLYHEKKETMDKRYYSPLELMEIATHHARCADDLLCEVVKKTSIETPPAPSLQPVISLMYIAFETTLRAWLLHDQRPVKQPKNLSELLELSRDLFFSSQELQLLKNLSRQNAFRKGVDYELWENSQQLLVFCSDIIKLYEAMQEMMPLELQREYQQ